MHVTFSVIIIGSAADLQKIIRNIFRTAELAPIQVPIIEKNLLQIEAANIPLRYYPASVDIGVFSDEFEGKQSNHNRRCFPIVRDIESQSYELFTIFSTNSVEDGIYALSDIYEKYSELKFEVFYENADKSEEGNVAANEFGVSYDLISGTEFYF